MKWVVLALVWIAAAAYLWLLPSDGLVAQRIYVDENALMPGSSHRTTAASVDELSAVVDDSLRWALRVHRGVAAADSEVRRRSIIERLARQDLEFEVYSHSLVPTATAGGDARLRLLYTAVLRSRAGPGDDALLLVTPLRIGGDWVRGQAAGQGAPGLGGDGLGLGLALLRTLARAPWLAKDIVWVIAEQEELAGDTGDSPPWATAAFEAWMEMYFGRAAHRQLETQRLSFRPSAARASAAANPEPVAAEASGFPRAGAVHAGLVLDVSLGGPWSGDRLRLHSIGSFRSRGLQPNLDAVSLVMEICQHHRLRLEIADTPSPLSPLSSFASPELDRLATVPALLRHPLERPMKDWLAAATHRSLLRHALESSGVRGLGSAHLDAMLRHGVDAVALSSVRLPRGWSPVAGATVPATGGRRLVSALESIFRSLNHLEEKLHHSMWFYMIFGRTGLVRLGHSLPLGLVFLAPVAVQSFGTLLRTPFPRTLRVLLGLLTGVASLILWRLALVRRWYLPLNPGLPGNDSAANGGDLVGVLAALGLAASLPWVARSTVAALSAPTPGSSAKPTGPSASQDDWPVLQALLGVAFVVASGPLCVVNFPCWIALLAACTPLLLTSQPNGSGNGRCNRCFGGATVVLNPVLVFGAAAFLRHLALFAGDEPLGAGLRSSLAELAMGLAEELLPLGEAPSSPAPYTFLGLLFAYVYLPIWVCAAAASLPTRPRPHGGQHLALSPVAANPSATPPPDRPQPCGRLAQTRITT